MRKILAIVLALLGFGFIVWGFYVAIFVMLIGGIMQVITEVRAPVMNNPNLYWGIAKVVCFEMGGLLAIPGYFCIMLALMITESRKFRNS